MDRTANGRLVLFLGFLFYTMPAFSAGAWLYETGIPTVGTAGAGRAALAADASAALNNPAGLVYLDSSNLLGGASLMFNEVNFRTESTTISGAGETNAGKFFPSPGFYYSSNPAPRLFSDLKMGFSYCSWISYHFKYKGDWPGRYYVRESQLTTFRSNPVVAYPILPWLSAGAGAFFVYGKLKQSEALNNSQDALSDGRLRVEESASGFGGNGGIMISPLPGFRFGVTYRSPLHLTFRSPAAIENIGPTLRDSLVSSNLLATRIKLDMTLPQEILAGFYAEIFPNLAVMLDGSWQDWAQFGDDALAPVASNEIPTLSRDRHFKSTWHAAIGVHYRVLQCLLVKTGFGYDSSPVDKEDRTPDLPLDRQFRYAGGLQYDLPRNVFVGADYEYIGLGKAPIAQNQGALAGSLVGEYGTDHSNIANVYAGWRF